MSSILRATASVNLISFDSQESTNGSISASSQGEGSEAKASVSPDGKIKIYASSQDAIPLYNAVAQASFVSAYTINGADGGLPVSFNFNLTGSLEANSDFGSSQLGQASIFLTATHNSFSQSNGFSSSSTTAGANLSVISGIPIFSSTGSFASSPSIKTQITPEINIEAKRKFKLTELDAIDLQLDLKFSGSPDNYDFPILSGVIANAINRFGLPRLNLAPGINADISFDVDYIFDSSLSFQPTLTESGSIGIGASATSSTLPGGSNYGTADYQNTFTLTSITVPKSYSLLDTTAFSITFDSGVKKQIFRQVDGEVSNGKEGNDLLMGSSKDDRLDGGDGNDRLLGLADSDILIGGSGNDILVGNENDDLLYGNEGDDILSGNAGNDILISGDGQDRFLFDIDKRFSKAIGIDLVLDFTAGSDKISLDKTTFTAIRKIDFATVKNLRQAQRSSAHITYIRKSGSLFYNQNGNRSGFGQGGQFADFEDGLFLNKSNFVVLP